MRRTLLPLFLACLAPTAALAQPTEAQMTEAQSVFADAADRFSEENYALAMQGFQRTFDLLEGYERQHLVLFNIARCHEELGQLHDPPLTKDAIAGRIRRLLAMADKRAEELGVPDTEASISEDLLPED